jgi:hypothetical protein
LLGNTLRNKALGKKSTDNYACCSFLVLSSCCPRTFPPWPFLKKQEQAQENIEMETHASHVVIQFNQVERGTQFKLIT